MAGAGGALAYAVVHSDPPDVYAADDVDTLQRVLALQVVAATPAALVPPGHRDVIRAALLDEEWGTAVSRWIEVTGTAVDVYDGGLEVWTADRFSEPDLAGLELRLRPLFTDG
jgi:hypothetical protein